MIPALAILSSVLITFAVAWYWWNWRRDWITRLKKRLPEPPVGYVWVLVSEAKLESVDYQLQLLDVMEEKSIYVGSILLSASELWPAAMYLDWLVKDARSKKYRLEPPELHTTQRFL